MRKEREREKERKRESEREREKERECVRERERIDRVHVKETCASYWKSFSIKV